MRKRSLEVKAWREEGGSKVTPLQKRVGDLLAEGLHAKEIGKELKMSGRGVKDHIINLCRLTGARGNVQLAVWWNCPIFKIGLGLEAK